MSLFMQSEDTVDSELKPQRAGQPLFMIKQTNIKEEEDSKEL